MSKNSEAEALIQMAEDERADEIKEELERLKTTPFQRLSAIFSIVALAFFYTYTYDLAREAPKVYYSMMFTVIVAGIVYAEAYRANKRVDLLIKLLENKI